MKVLVILYCVSVFAHAQSGTQYQSSFGQNTRSSSRYQNQNGGQFQSRNQNYQQNQYQNQNQYQQTQQNQYQQNQYQQNQQNQYQQQQYQQASSGSCRENNGKYPVAGSCDRYIECIDGIAEEKLCPDGLRFNPNATAYPCVYPNEAPCLERSALQPAQPTEECPNQFAYVRLGDSANCGTYRSCVNGRAYDINCPEGLAFDMATYRCDWPDLVADCDAEAFLGVRCPEVSTNELGAPAGFTFFRSNENCQKYFYCVEGRPRLSSCGGANGFDEATSSCVPADEVSVCPPELQARAREYREEEKLRQAELAKFAASRQLKKNF